MFQNLYGDSIGFMAVLYVPDLYRDGIRLMAMLNVSEPIWRQYKAYCHVVCSRTYMETV